MGETKQRIYLIMAAVAIAIWAYNNFQRHDTPDAPAPQLAPAAYQSVATQLRPTPDLTAVKNKPWGADPFFHRRKRAMAPRQTKTASLEANVYTLKAIIYNETAPSAYLNNRVVRLGDVIDGAKIIKISKRAVTLRENGHEFTVTVKRG